MQTAIGKVGAGRIALAVCAGGYFLLLVALGGHNAWARLGVRLMPPLPRGSRSFADLRELTTAWKCTARGVHIVTVDPCDPWGRAFDHPRLWLIPGSLGAGDGHTFLLGMLIAVVFFVSAVAVLPRSVGVLGGLAYAFVLCSPAIMLGVERGNADMTLFPLVLGGALLLRRGRPGLVAGAALFLLAGMLKLAPIFAVLALARRRGRDGLIALGCTCAFFAAYVVVVLSDLRALSKALPQSDTLAFGIRRLTEWVTLAVGDTRPSLVAQRVIDLAFVALALGIAVLAQRRFVARAPEDDAAARDLDLFVAGAAIYGGSYVLTHNKDYRLVFLLLVLPQLFRWMRERRAAAFVTYAALVGATWLDQMWPGVPVLGALLAKWNAGTAHITPDPLRVPVIAQAVLFLGLAIGLVAVGRQRFAPVHGDGKPEPGVV